MSDCMKVVCETMGYSCDIQANYSLGIQLGRILLTVPICQMILLIVPGMVLAAILYTVKGFLAAQSAQDL